MSSHPFPKDYYEANETFEIDLKNIKKRNQVEVNYLITYGQVTNSVTLEITNDLPAGIQIEIRESFKRNFKSFSINFRNL